MNTKISEAAVEAAFQAYISHYDTVETSIRAALEAAYPHLQGEAVSDKGPWELCAGEPGSVISDDFTHDVILRVHGDFDSNEALANYCKWLVSRLNHPQPAELNEVSGNSGELWIGEDGPDSVWIFIDSKTNITGYSETGPELTRPGERAVKFVRAALAATGKQQVGEVQGDALLESLVTRWRKDAGEVGAYDNTLCQKIANCTMRHAAELQAVIAARQPVAAQGIDPSPIATRKLAELAVQGYVTNGVAIFNPATGHRGLVDNLGFVGWMGEERDAGAWVEDGAL